MSRERLTGETNRKAAILSALKALRVAVEQDEEVKEVQAAEVKATTEVKATDDADLVSQADAAAKKEKEVVQQSLTTDVTLKDQGDQNAKANANWTLTEAEREKIASSLITLAEQILT